MSKINIDDIIEYIYNYLSNIKILLILRFNTI
jgi:hypothetical protein